MTGLRDTSTDCLSAVITAALTSINTTNTTATATTYNFVTTTHNYKSSMLEVVNWWILLGAKCYCLHAMTDFVWSKVLLSLCPCKWQQLHTTTVRSLCKSSVPATTPSCVLKDFVRSKVLPFMPLQMTTSVFELRENARVSLVVSVTKLHAINYK